MRKDHFTDEALRNARALADLKSQDAESFAEAYDFARCQRPNGTFYGIPEGKQCKKGTKAAPAEKPASKDKRVGRMSKLRARAAEHEGALNRAKPGRGGQNVEGLRRDIRASTVRSLKASTRKLGAKIGADAAKNKGGKAGAIARGEKLAKALKTLDERIRKAKEENAPASRLIKLSRQRAKLKKVVDRDREARKAISTRNKAKAPQVKERSIDKIGIDRLTKVVDRAYGRSNSLGAFNTRTVRSYVGEYMDNNPKAPVKKAVKAIVENLLDDE